MTTRELSTDKQAAKSLKWLQKALPPKNSRDELRQVFYAGEYSFGSDGYRIHQTVGRLAEVTPIPAKLADGVKRAKDTVHNTTTSATVSTSQLEMLAKQSKAFITTPSNPLVLKFAPESLFARAVSAEFGSWESALVPGDPIPHWRNDPKYKVNKLARRIDEPVVYRQSGPSVEMAVNPRYLLDALSGMGEEVIVLVRPDMLSLQSGEREAVIMGLHLGK